MSFCKDEMDCFEDKENCINVVAAAKKTPTDIRTPRKNLDFYNAAGDDEKTDTESDMMVLHPVATTVLEAEGGASNSAHVVHKMPRVTHLRKNNEDGHGVEIRSNQNY